ncbi:hypothetical protein PR003_g4286 [Phytophthora rubi]|uniref:Uncharacterized protein n=1 Tax=Phytophthora rubi TaxID=129364 RepID=A0A6A3P5H9_9STRA|nr:hypothetical protein PR002_g4265 [Phytophthora rubi]KAE9048824.1 hypothetical protein PR001_g3687 [Phytophthora rubi]KAE9352622.1 hypothetical protein PR003_g4286 [Phytophthora rubi]
MWSRNTPCTLFTLLIFATSCVGVYKFIPRTARRVHATTRSAMLRECPGSRN